MRGGDEAVPVGPVGSVFERRFWLFAAGVVLVFVLIQTFDFTLVPPEYRGFQLTRPFCDLHSSHEAARAWAGRSLLKYGLGYTKGYATLAVGDPPHLIPEYEVSDLPADGWICALGMLVFGAQDWSARLFDLALSAACLLAILALLRRLYGSERTLLSGLLLVLLPLSGCFGSEFLMLLLGLWAFCRYLQLAGRLGGELGGRSRHLIELAISLFLLVQLNWAGIFYALAVGLHYVFYHVVRRQFQWRVLAVLAVASLSSLALDLYVMAGGLRHNLSLEAPYGGSEASVLAGTDSSWGLVRSLYQLAGVESEQGSFSWLSWLDANLRHAHANFSAPILIFLAVYLLYLVAAHARGLARRLIHPSGGNSPGGSARILRPFPHLWFLVLPGLMFVFAFEGLLWRHPYWQSPFALFVAVGAASSVLLAGDVFRRVHVWLGRSVVVVLIVMISVFCNHGLAEYRDIREQSPRTLALFERLNKEIRPDRALLTFKDYAIRRGKGEPAVYQPEYAWYLDREMVPANAWRYEPKYWALSVRIEDVATKTVREVQARAQTGCFRYYLIPAREEHGLDLLAERLRGQGIAQVLRNANPGESAAEDSQDSRQEPWIEKPTGAASLSEQELDRYLSDKNPGDDEALYWEKHRRYREAVIAQLKDLYDYEYYENRALPGDEDFCYKGDTPCHLFDLLRPK
jgi:hypothetical protein